MGDVLILWSFNLKNPLRISFFDGVVESIVEVDSSTFRSLRSLDSVFLYLKNIGDVFSFNLEKEKRFSYPLVVSYEDVDYGFESFDFGFRSIPALEYCVKKKDLILKVVDEYIKRDFKIFCCSKKRKDLDWIEKGRDIYFLDFFLEKGFLNNELKFLLITDFELFGEFNLGSGEDWLKNIVPGDFLVHEDHGIGVFEGIVKKEDIYIDIRYAGKDRLLVPVSQSEKVTKYLGGKVPVLTSLSGGLWKRTKKRVREDANLLAKELLQLYAMREVFKFDIKFKRDELKKDFDIFSRSFEFEDTVDQRVVSEEVFDDMTSSVLMDRLLVGDVGFGKTEIALRAAFLAMRMGLQVVVLAPTTILVSQHSFVFKKRFENFNFNVSNISRLTEKKEREKILSGLEDGSIDLVVGTHSVLSDSVRFKNLGLIIIDEEQKFGVKQKEKLRKKRVESHVLAMSATPIPRSMHMSLSGIRDISSLFTPPKGRKSIKNWFGGFDWGVVKSAIQSEVERGGQVYFLHNRVADIEFTRKRLIEIFPDLNFGVLHGQLHPNDIARVMDLFCSKKIDVLITTTIIENGLDLPNVNTLIVEDSSRFGLSQLYQIRGRIGRSSVQGFAFFFYSGVSKSAGLRLDALSESSSLGSGFLIANRDLEIRGAGSLLGSAQSGCIDSVGYGLFMSFLRDEVDSLRGGS